MNWMFRIFWMYFFNCIFSLVLTKYEQSNKLKYYFEILYLFKCFTLNFLCSIQNHCRDFDCIFLLKLDIIECRWLDLTESQNKTAYFDSSTTNKQIQFRFLHTSTLTCISINKHFYFIVSIITQIDGARTKHKNRRKTEE